VLPKGFSQLAVDTVVGARKDQKNGRAGASQLALEAFTANLPEMLGGS
jgi:transketolase